MGLGSEQEEVVSRNVANIWVTNLRVNKKSSLIYL